MRTLTHGDAVAAACLIRGLAAGERQPRLHALFAQAEAADRFRKRTGRAHPEWGDGSLMSAALRAGAVLDEPFLSDMAYLLALATVLDALLDWRSRPGGNRGASPFPPGRDVLS